MNTFKVETKSGFIPYHVWYVESENIHVCRLFYFDNDMYVVTEVEVKELL